MLFNLFFIAIFISGVYYLIRYRMNIEQAVELSKNALYPRKKEEFQSILLPGEWKEMEQLTKNTRS